MKREIFIILYFNFLNLFLSLYGARFREKLNSVNCFFKISPTVFQSVFSAIRNNFT